MERMLIDEDVAKLVGEQAITIAKQQKQIENLQHAVNNLMGAWAICDWITSYRPKQARVIKQLPYLIKDMVGKEGSDA